MSVQRFAVDASHDLDSTLLYPAQGKKAIRDAL